MAIAISSYQPSLVLTQTIDIRGVFPSRDSFNSTMTIGMIHTYGFNFGMNGAPLAAGQILPISQNTAVFSLLGTLYGGNGQTTFALPDLSGRTIVGDGEGPGLTSVFLGEQDGSATTLLTQQHMPASVGGISASVDEAQPQLGLKYLIRFEGSYQGSDLGMLGSVVQFAGNFAPGGYLECAGQLLDILTYEALFNLIGTTFGGDGITTFALPDLRGRTIVGAGGSHFLGEPIGQEGAAIGQANLPVEMGGGGQPIDNREPSLALNYIIALQGIFPSRDGGAGYETPLLGEIIATTASVPPNGWAFAAGQLLPINQYQALFSLLGTQYGGDGRVNFALPDLRGRDVIGQGNGLLVGEVVGEQFTTLTLDNIPDLSYSGTNADGTHYGANGNDNIRGLGGNDTITAHGGNDVLDGGTGNDTMTGGAGNDTYFVDSSGDVATEGVGGGTDRVFTTVSYALAAGLEVESLFVLNAALTSPINLTGNSFNQTITGNAGINILQGGGGNDTLVGLGGPDTLDGGTGIDRVDYSASNAAVTVNLTTNTGQGGHAEGDTYIGIENAIGSAFSDRLTGGPGNNVLTGLAGNDVYVVDSAGDLVVEAAGGGADAVLATVSYVLGAGQHVETLATSNAAGTGAINLTGNELSNRLIGNAGANILNGGAGIDELYGNGGSDVFHVDAAADRVFEAAGGGTDAVLSSVTYTLAAGQEIETLATNNVAGIGAINLTGNEFANRLIGNAGANILNGGAGIDQLYGNGGNDVFYVDVAADRVFEAVGGGTDTVLARASFAMIAGQEIETLATTNVAGTGAINLTGNEFANRLIGNAGANILNGGAGVDQLYGNGGNDVFHVDAAADRTFEAVGGGTDAVLSSVTYTLAAGQEIETLATNNVAGTDAINLTGNEFANRLIGNAGANILNGGAGVDQLYGNGGNDTLRGEAGNDILHGGAGADTLFGGADNDLFYFAAGEANGDTVADFVGNDALSGDALRFTGYGTAAQGATFVQLNATQWQINSANGLVHDVITFSNAAEVHSSDFLFS